MRNAVGLADGSSSEDPDGAGVVAAVADDPQDEPSLDGSAPADWDAPFGGTEPPTGAPPQPASNEAAMTQGRRRRPGRSDACIVGPSRYAMPSIMGPSDGRQGNAPSGRGTGRRWMRSWRTRPDSNRRSP